MEFKVQIKCESCKCCFEIRPAKFNAKDALSCPNCGASVPDDIADKLRAGIAALGSVPSRFPKEDCVSYRGFSFDVKEISPNLDKFIGED